jgi:hypothetical protein
VNCLKLRSESLDIMAKKAVKRVFKVIKALASCKTSLSLKKSFV